MKSTRIYFKKNLNLTSVLISLILALGLFLRLHNYTQFPPRGASSDEYTYSFLGMSLLEKGVPTSWSFFPQYFTTAHTYNLTIDHIFFPMVTPYFDHPPLYGILVGGWAMLNGQESFSTIKIGTIRQIPIALGIITSLLLYILSYKLYGKKTALWALLIYSTSTIIVIETRAVFAENLFTPILLGSILLIYTLQKHVSVKKIIILGVLSGLSIWIKEFGIIVYLTIISLLLIQKVKIKMLLIVTGIFIIGVILYLLYGYAYNWNLFQEIIFTQSSRNIGPETLYTLFFHPILVNKQYVDGWYLLGFVSLFSSFTNFFENKYIIIPSFLYLLICLFFLTSKAEMGWYMIPLFPFFSIITAHTLVTSIKNRSWYIYVVTLFIGMYAIQYRIEPKYGLTSQLFRGLLIVLFAPLLLLSFFKKERLFEIISNTWFYVFIFITVLITFRYIHPL